MSPSTSAGDGATFGKICLQLARSDKHLRYHEPFQRSPVSVLECVVQDLATAMRHVQVKLLLGTEVNPGSILSLFFRTFLLKYFEIRLSKSFNYFHRHRSESCYGPNQGLPKIRRRADVTFWSSCLKKLSGALAWIWTWHGDII